jgi:hypothetical protein
MRDLAPLYFLIRRTSVRATLFPARKLDELYSGKQSCTYKSAILAEIRSQVAELKFYNGTVTRTFGFFPGINQSSCAERKQVFSSGSATLLLSPVILGCSDHGSDMAVQPAADCNPVLFHLDSCLDSRFTSVREVLKKL